MLQTTWKVGLILEGHHTLHSISPLQVFLGASQLVGYSVLLQSATASYCHLRDGLVLPSAPASVLNI